MVKDAENLHYNDRLQHLGLVCLHTRRIRSDLIDTYKIMYGIYNVKTELLFDCDQSDRRPLHSPTHCDELANGEDDVLSSAHQTLILYVTSVSETIRKPPLVQAQTAF